MRLSNSAVFDELRTTRRHLLQVGGTGLLGLTLSGLLRAAEKSGNHKPRAKSVIFPHQWGGPSHHDTLDMKPTAPEAIGGELKPIPTKAPGIVISEKLPRLAQVMDKCTLVRSLYHTMKNHNSA